MISFVYKGEFNMKNYFGSYENIEYKNRASLKLEDECYINELYAIFEEKFKTLSANLIKYNIDPEEWDMNFVKKEAQQSINKIKLDFIKHQALEWRMKLSLIVKELIRKSSLNFLQADELYIEELDRYEQYYDLLNNMFDNTEELIKIKYKEYIVSKQENLNILIERNYLLSHIEDDMINVEIISNNRQNRVNNYKIAA